MVPSFLPSIHTALCCRLQHRNYIFHLPYQNYILHEFCKPEFTKSLAPLMIYLLGGVAVYRGLSAEKRMMLLRKMIK